MSRTAPLPVVLGALLLVGTIGGTARAQDRALVDPNPGAGPGAVTLEGTEWLLVKAQLSGAYADIPADVGATLLMVDGQAGGSGGCNQWFASYALDGQALHFGETGSTLMMCAGPGGDVEAFYFADLGSVTGWDITGSTLTLSSDLGPVLAFEPRSGSGPVLEGSWTIVAYNDGQGALVAVDDGSAILTVAEGQVAGTAGCNRFTGSITQDANTISVGPLASTEMYCEGRMEQEAAILASLQASTSVQAQDGGLTLLDAAGTVQLQLVPAAGVPEASPAA